MINDAVPQQEARWVVLIEAETCPGYQDHRWQLAATHAVSEGGRAAADELAQKLAMEYVPRKLNVSVGKGDTAARKVFRVTDGSWLVEVRGFDQERSLCRITIAELVHEQRYVHAPYEPEPEPRVATAPSRKRRLWGRT
ncbi:hypothetical protein [Streptomyces sp. NPDC091371]|uniref:hypothetical protein n=1 Tax=Streptomyces sp. NPDC091371 TaxID=3155303 RepID=UPI00341C43D8